MKRISRRGKIILTAAICLAVLAVGGIAAAVEIGRKTPISNGTPIVWSEWLIGPCLVRTRQNTVLLRFTPSGEYRARYTWYEESGGDGTARIVSSDFPSPRCLIEMKTPPENVLIYHPSMQDLIVLPNGDWLIPIGRYYDEETHDIVSIAWHDATVEEVRSLVERGISVSGNTQIAAEDRSTAAETFIFDGFQKQILLFRAGDVIPAVDDETQEAFDRYAEKHTRVCVQPGDVMRDGKG